MVPLHIFTNILDKVCETGVEYIIDKHVYKRMKFHRYHVDFLESLLPYYHESKKFYITRDFTYTSFMTIIRQIARLHDITIRSTIHYGNSTYAISYIILKT